MKPLFNLSIIPTLKRSDTVQFECEHCGTIFNRLVNWVQFKLKHPNSKNEFKYCSPKCANQAKITGKILPCGQCGKICFRTLGEYKKSKSGKIFCSQSCAATYSNTHKTKGNRRSKLEQWLEKRLSELFPNLKILYSDKSIVKSELDIYIPSFKLAFEINGVFHYQPIYGQEKLNQIQKNDIKKNKLCSKEKIELITIDVSKQKRFTMKSSEKYLQYISDIIKERI